MITYGNAPLLVTLTGEPEYMGRRRRSKAERRKRRRKILGAIFSPRRAIQALLVKKGIKKLKSMKIGDKIRARRKKRLEARLERKRMKAEAAAERQNIMESAPPAQQETPSTPYETPPTMDEEGVDTGEYGPDEAESEEVTSEEVSPEEETAEATDAVEQIEGEEQAGLVVTASVLFGAWIIYKLRNRD